LEYFSYDPIDYYGVIGETFQNKSTEILYRDGHTFIGIQKLNVIKKTNWTEEEQNIHRTQNKLGGIMK
jgi:hypothetical protein